MHVYFKSKELDLRNLLVNCPCQQLLFLFFLFHPFEENCVGLKACLNQTIHHNTYKSIQGFAVNSVLQMIIVLLSCFQFFHH